MDSHNVSPHWSPGHMGIEGNDLADALAQQGALPGMELPDGPDQSAPEAQHTASGIQSLA